MHMRADVKPVNRGGVVGLGLGRYVFVGAGVALMLAANCMGAPENARVAAGKASVRQRGNTTVIRASDRAIIDYSRFDIRRNESVRFIQPGANATVLNRIHSTRPTVIDGSLTSNGRVYLINPGGILFTGNAQVQTRGLVAAAASVSNKDFLAGHDHFTNVRGDVENRGRIDAGAAAVLIGRHVSNSGSIIAGAPDGVVAMVAGDEVTLVPRGSNISIKVARDESAQPVTGDRPGVDNSGRISAPRGRSLMLANDIYSLAARNTGTVRAKTISVESRGDGEVRVSGKLDASGSGASGKGGTIEVTGQRVLVENATLDARGDARGGDIRVGGDRLGQGDLRRAEATAVDGHSRLMADANRAGAGGSVVVWSDGPTRFHGEASASGGAASGAGGFIETSGHGVDVSGAKVEAGSPSGGVAGKWLIDPFNVTIQDSDGAPSGSPPMLNPFTPIMDTTVDADDIAIALATTPVEITTGGVGGVATDGNITVADTGAITYNGAGAATLTLRAANNITVNAGITTTGGALTVNLLGNDSAGGNVDNDTTVGQVAINNGGANTGRILSGNGGVNISGVDLDLSGASATVDAGSGDIVLTANSTANQSVGLGAAAAGTFNLTATEFGQLASSGRVTVSSPVDAVSSAVAITTLGLAAEDFNLTVTGETLTAGSVTLNTAKDLELAARAGTATVTGTLSVPTGTITLRGDDIDVDGGVVSITATTGTVTYAANSGRDVELDTAAGAGFRISQAEIDNTTAATIEVRNDGPDTDNITVGTPTIAGATDLRLVTAGKINEAVVNNTTDITMGTGTLILRSGTGVGAAGTDDGTGMGPLDINADIVDAQATGVGGIFIKATGPLTVRDARTTDGKISIRTNSVGPAATMTVENVSAIESVPSGRTLELVADGNLISMPPLMTDMVASNGSGYFESTRSGDDITINNADVGAFTGSTVSLKTVAAGVGDATFNSVQPIALVLADVGGNLTVISRGEITQTAALTVRGNATFKTLNNAGADITLSNAANLFGTNIAPGELTALVRDAGDGMATDGNVSIFEATTALNPMNVTQVQTLGTATLRADFMTIGGVANTVSTGAGAIRLEPLDATAPIGLGTGAGTLSLDQGELQNLDTTGIVTIGRDTGTGLISINNGAAIDLTMRPYNLTLRGGDIAFAQRLNLGGPASIDRQFTLIGDDVTTSLAAGTPSFQVDGTRGRVLFDVTGDVGAGTAISGSVDQMSARLRTAAKSIDYINVGSALEIASLGTTDAMGAPVTISGIQALNNGNITLRSGLPITITNGLVTSGTGMVGVSTTTAGDIIDNTGAMGTAVTVGTAGSITLDSTGGRVSGVMATDAFKTTTGAASAGMFARLAANADTGINITNAGTGEVRATLTTAAGQARLRHLGALTTGGADWAADSFDVETTGDFTSRDAAAMTPDEITATGNVSIRSTAGAMTIQDRVRSTGTGNVMLRAQGAMTINATAMGVMPTVSANTGNVAITSDNGIVDINAEVKTVTDGDVNVTGAAAVSIDGDVEATMGNVSIRSTGNAVTTSRRVRSIGTGDVSIRADDNVTISAAPTMPTVSADTGNVTLTSDTGAIEINGEVRTTVDGNINAAAMTNIAVNDMLEATMGDIGLIADGTVTITDIVKTNPGDVTISAADLNITGVGQVNAMNMGMVGGDVVISRKTEGVIDVGEAGPVQSLPVMVITNAELDAITASSLSIGDSNNTRLIRVTGVIEPGDAAMPEAQRAHDTIGSVSLAALRDTGAIVFRGTDTSYFTSLTAHAGAGIKVEHNLVATTGILSLDADFNAADVPSGMSSMVLGVDADKIDVLHFSGARSLTTLGAASAVSDVSLSGRRPGSGTPATGILGSDNLTINSKHDIDINQNIDISQTLTLNADNQVRLAGGGNGRTLNISAREGIRFTGNIGIGAAAQGGLTVNADSNGDGGVFELIPDAMGRGTLTLGNNSALRITASDFRLDGNIAGAGGTVRIGRAAAGDIHVGNFADMAGFMTINNAELSRIECANLTIGNFESTTPAPTVTNTFTNAIAVNGVGATDSDGISGVVTLDAGTTLTFTGAASTFRSVEGRAVGDVTVDAGAPLTTTTGEMRLLADHAPVGMTASDAVGNLVINSALRTNGANFTGEGADLRLASALDTTGTSGLGDVILSRPSGGTITVDNAPTDSASRMSISDSELQLITARNLTIGDNTRVTTVNVRNVSDADGAGIAGETRFQSDNEIVFMGTNRFGQLAASADQRIDVLGDITSTRGSLSLNANADNNANGTNAIEFTGTRVLDSATDLTLSVSGGNITAETGSLTLTANDNVTINDNLTVSDALTIRADDETDLDGVGTVLIASSATERADVLARNGAINITGVAINLGPDGSLIAGGDSVSLIAKSGITIAGNITSSGGLTLRAGDDDAATGVVNGDLSVVGARTLRANTNGANIGDVSISAATATIDTGASIIGARNVTVTRSSTGRIGLGSVAEGGLVLSKQELDTITATGDLTIGDSLTTRIDLSAIQNTDLDKVTGVLRLSALGDGGTIDFQGTAAQQFGTLDAKARTLIQTAGDISAIRGGISLDGGATTPNNVNDGSVILGGDLLTTSTSGTSADVLVTGPTQIRDDVVVTAQRNATFSSTIRSPNRRNLLTVNATGSVTAAGRPDRLSTITFGGDLGLAGGERLYGLSINPGTAAARRNSVTMLGGSVFTADGRATRPNAGVRFRDPVIITKNVTIDDNGANGVFFHRRVEPLNAGQQSLSIAVRRNAASPDTFTLPVPATGTTPARPGEPAQIPIIAFGGNVGTNAKPFKSIKLNVPNENDAATNGHVNPQALPTIVVSRFGRVVSSTQTNEDEFRAVPPTGFGPQFGMVSTESFNMGKNEKLTAIGSLAISVVGNGSMATVADLTALGNINVNADKIRIRGRKPGPQFDAGSVAGRPLALDSGTDFVAGRDIKFSSSPQSDRGFSQPTFGSPRPRPAGANLDNFLYREFKPSGALINADLTRTVTTATTSQTFFVDLEPNGPSDTNFADSIAGFIPRESRVNDVGQETIISAALKEKLTQVGVSARNLTGDERLAALAGWTTYNDLPRKRVLLAVNDSTVETTVNRLPEQPTNDVVDRFYGLILGSTIDPETGKPLGDQREVIRKSFADAGKEFKKASGGGKAKIEPRALRQFVDANDAKAKDYADRIGLLLDDLVQLGLVGKELNQTKSAILKDVRPQSFGWSMSEFELFIHLPKDQREDNAETGQ